MFTNPHISADCRLRVALRAGFFGCLLLIGAILLWPAAGVYAQSEGEVPDETIVQQGETEEVEAEQETAEESEPIPLETDKPPSRFIPSEEISEDYSVPFPVDI
jgi:hypothetical protein